jgi:poly-gamma-glutamate synthesis protein (capsule biosynthesis protein)
MGKKLSFLATGELILSMDEEKCKEPTFYFEPVKELFEKSDLVVAHLESPHTDRPVYQGAYIAKAPAMRNIVGIKYAGIDAVTMAGNPTASYGRPGVEDTTNWLTANGIGYVGAGLNIDEARKPLIMERDGVKFGFLAYDTTSTDRSRATKLDAGAAYVDVVTYFHPKGFPGSAPTVMTFIEHWSLEAMREDIRALRPQCDVLTVAIHQGLGFQSQMTDYEYELPRHAIEEGADLIVANHSHVIKAIEFYMGAPVFHSTGNLVCVFPWETHSMFFEDPVTTLGKSKIRPRATGAARAILDYDAPNYPFPSKEAIIGKLIVDTDTKRIEEVRLLPVYVNNEGQPIVHGDDEKGRQVFDTMVRVTKEAELNAGYKWDGDEIVVYCDEQ